MQNEVKQVHGRVRWGALRRWLFVEPYLAWLAAGGLLAAWMIGYVMADNLERQVLSAGIVLEVLGLLVVARGFAEVRERFGEEALSRRALKWLRRFPALFRPPERRTARGSVTLGPIGVTGSGYLWQGVPPNATHEQRLEVLEANVAALNNRVDESIIAVKNEVRSSASALGERLNALEKDGSETREQLKALAVSGLGIEFVGLFWVAVGVVMAGVPEIISHALASVWGQ